MKFEIGISIVIGLLALFVISSSFIRTIPTNTFQDDVVYDRLDLYQMHDVIVNGDIMGWSNDTKPYVILRVNEYLKNPQQAEYLTVHGDLGLNGDYCLENPSKCDHILAYLYRNKNGIYFQGETFAWITSECDARCLIEVNLETTSQNVED